MSSLEVTTAAKQIAETIPQEMLPVVASTKGLTHHVITDFCRLAAEGVPMTVICDYLGYPSGTIYTWLKRGQDWFENDGFPQDDIIYGAFLQQLKRHHAEYLIATVRDLNTADSKEWQKLMTILERRDRGTWGRMGSDGLDQEAIDPDEKFL